MEASNFAELMKTVPPWFLFITVIALGFWFVWSIKHIFTDFKAAVCELKNLISELFEKHDHHETRISKLEARCETTHALKAGGRRIYDSPEDLER